MTGTSAKDPGGADDTDDADDTDGANASFLRRHRFFIGSHPSQSAIWSHGDFEGLSSEAAATLRRFKVKKVPPNIDWTARAVGESGVMGDLKFHNVERIFHHSSSE